MHHAIALEENNEQNLHIWSNLTWFFQSWLIWTLPLAWFGFGFDVKAIHSWFVMTFLSKSESSLNVINISWAMSMRQCFAFLQFCNFGTNFAASYFMPKTSVKPVLPTSSATSLIVIRRCFKIIFFTASMFSSIADVLGRLGRLTSSLKPVIPQLNLCSAYSRLSERHSQHFKCSCIFNFIFYIKLN